jgi:hypothetical protein
MESMVIVPESLLVVTAAHLGLRTSAGLETRAKPGARTRGNALQTRRRGELK